MTSTAASALSLWRNRLARSAVNRKVGGSSPPRDVLTFELDTPSTGEGDMAIDMLQLSMTLFLVKQVVPGWARTTNLSVNSRTR